MGSKSTTWSPRFDEPVDALMTKFNASIPFDQQLLDQELRASIAHARMLGATGIIDAADSDAIIAGLERLTAAAAAGSFSWSLADEDIHTAVERRLTEDIGAAGKRLHTARSRNDQVSTVTRLWLREQIDGQLQRLAQARLALLEQAQRNLTTVMPGFTHLQVAQPTTLAHHLHAHACMLARDSERLGDCRRRVNLLPLGAVALAGTSLPIAPQQVAQELGFAGLCPNSMDAVADRDYAIEYAAAAALVMTHLSRLGEELVIWSSQPFSFVRFADAYSTGSSVMPQKRNPDAAELLRGKVGRVCGHLVALLNMVKGQPLAYNKDNQEDKEALFDTAATVSISLEVTAGMVAVLEFNPVAMRQMAELGYATATDLADLLVRNGMPFRDAHGKVAAAVNAAEKAGVALADLPAADLERITGLEASVARQALDLDAAVTARAGPGGPAPATLAVQLAADVAAANKQLRSS